MSLPRRRGRTYYDSEKDTFVRQNMSFSAKHPRAYFERRAAELCIIDISGISLQGAGSIQIEKLGGMVAENNQL